MTNPPETRQAGVPHGRRYDRPWLRRCVVAFDRPDMTAAADATTPEE